MIIKNDNTKHMTGQEIYFQFLALLGNETDWKAAL